MNTTNTYQQFFDECCKALLAGTYFPTPHPASFTHNALLQAFQDIRRDMAPRAWRDEVHAVAAEFELDSEVFSTLWERTSRKDLVSVASE